MQGRTAAADLNTSVMTVSSRYRHENQNSIYYVKPASNDIYFLDFKLKGFVKEQLKWSQRGRGSIPAQATTMQTTDSSIYIIGGQKQSTGASTVVGDTYQIDAMMTVYER